MEYFFGNFKDVEAETFHVVRGAIYKILKLTEALLM
jgi:hypothetical protein